MKHFVIFTVCIVLIAGYAFAQKMDDGVNNPFISGIKKLIAGKAGNDTVTVKAGSAGHLLGGQVMVAVSYIVKSAEKGNGAAFAVVLPHRTFTARVVAGRRIPIQVNQETYFLDFVSVSDSSATFKIQKGASDEQL